MPAADIQPFPANHSSHGSVMKSSDIEHLKNIAGTINYSKPFGHEDFDLTRVQSAYPDICPVKGCETPTTWVTDSRGERRYCAMHGIRLHSNTFVYWDGENRKDDARLRNFPIRPDIAREVALNAVGKAESHRLCYEMSEDALTWNVFVGPAEAKRLRDAVLFLTGDHIEEEPRLYLWGELVESCRQETRALSSA